MKLNFDVVLSTFDGTAIKNADNTDTTLKKVAIDALLAAFQDEANLQGSEKFDRYKLAEKINSGKVELSTEEIALIKKLIGKGYTPLTVGAAFTEIEHQMSKGAIN